MNRRVTTIVSSAIAAGALALGVAFPAVATATDPKSGDDRATAHSGNATTCEHAGLAGEIVEVESVVDPTGRYLNIISVPDGFVLTGTVVKGGPAYNVYPPSATTMLHSPLVSNGNIPQISHWYACGVESGGTTTSTPTKTSTPTGTGTETSTPTGTETSTPAPTSTSPVGGGEEDELPNTGASTSGLLIGGIALLLLGSGLVFAVRRGRFSMGE